jgi:hypothetical protein
MTQYHPILIHAAPGGTYAGQPFANPQPYPFHADTADFSNFADCCRLATLGVFPIDRAEHRAKREAEAAQERMFEDAYAAFNLDRKHEHGRIAAEIEGTLTSGIWARSTGEYAHRCRELDLVIAARVYERIV